VAQIARAYAIAREIFDVRIAVAKHRGLDYQVPADLQYDTSFQISRMCAAAVYWLLRAIGEALEIEPMIQRLKAGRSHACRRRSAEARDRRTTAGARATTCSLENIGLPRRSGERVAALALMTQMLDVVKLSRELRSTRGKRRSFTSSSRAVCKLDWVREQIEGHSASTDYWQRARPRRAARIARSARSAHADVDRRRSRPKQPRARHWPSWLAAGRAHRARCGACSTKCAERARSDFATLSVALRELEQLH
jgi:glutamate dehydrogenase